MFTSFSFWARLGSVYEGLFTGSSERAQDTLQTSSISTDLIWKSRKKKKSLSLRVIKSEPSESLRLEYWFRQIAQFLRTGEKLNWF